MPKVLILLILLPSCGEYLWPKKDYQLVHGTKVEVYTEPGHPEYAQKCFLDNVDAYTNEIDLLAGDSVPVTISEDIRTWAGAYYLDAIWLNPNAPNQLSAYGHELVRHYCYYTQKCQYDEQDITWEGYIGSLWNKAENLSLLYCPN